MLCMSCMRKHHDTSSEDMHAALSCAIQQPVVHWQTFKQQITNNAIILIELIAYVTVNAVCRLQYVLLLCEFAHPTEGHNVGVLG